MFSSFQYQPGQPDGYAGVAGLQSMVVSSAKIDKEAPRG